MSAITCKRCIALFEKAEHPAGIKRCDSHKRKEVNMAKKKKKKTKY